MSRWKLVLLFAFGAKLVFCDPTFENLPGMTIVEQGKSTASIQRTIAGHSIELFWNYEAVGYDIKVDGKLVSRITSDMLPSNLGVSLFRAENYFNLFGPLPPEIKLTYGLSLNGGVLYYLIYLIDSETESMKRSFCFLMPYKTEAIPTIYFYVEQDELPKK